jgi:hypothetical protein
MLWSSGAGCARAWVGAGGRVIASETLGDSLGVPCHPHNHSCNTTSAIHHATTMYTFETFMIESEELGYRRVPECHSEEKV